MDKTLQSRCIQSCAKVLDYNINKEFIKDNKLNVRTPSLLHTWDNSNFQLSLIHKRQ